MFSGLFFIPGLMFGAIIFHNAYHYTTLMYLMYCTPITLLLVHYCLLPGEGLP